MPCLGVLLACSLYLRMVEALRVVVCGRAGTASSRTVARKVIEYLKRELDHTALMSSRTKLSSHTEFKTGAEMLCICMPLHLLSHAARSRNSALTFWSFCCRSGLVPEAKAGMIDTVRIRLVDCRGRWSREDL